jgi:rubredoxin
MPGIVYSLERINILTQESAVQRYRCIVCNYIYDPAVGDIERGVPSGTPFENLPDDWVCPVCGAGKDMFEQVN